MWEYGLKRLDSYGSPMSLMLLPHWTDGCLASMEGLFFESTQTVPFHFINQDELSLEPSRPVRAVPYGGIDLNAGTRHMQLFGVRYYMAFSDSLITEARAHEGSDRGGRPAALGDVRGGRCAAGVAAGGRTRGGLRRRLTIPRGGSM